MTAKQPRILICSCEGSMPLDAGAVAKGCGAAVGTADQLCRAQLDRFRAALAEGAPLTVGCTQEQPVFQEAAEDAGATAPLRFANLRETAGWADAARDAGPKMAALLAGAAVEMPPIAMTTAASQGVALILGRDATAIEAGRRLADHLDVTVLLRDPQDVAPPRVTLFPVLKGRVASATGRLGAFSLTIDGYALPDPSSRSGLRFGPARDGATSTCDLILDLTGDAGLFPEGLRAGYLRADPGAPAAVARALFDAAQLVGEFDRPRYITFDAGLCAHSRSKITGCTRCLDLCPAGAITPAGDSVAIDPMICAGCGQCAAACPTGAASYALPPAEAVVARLRAMLRAYAAAGGPARAGAALLLIHDDDHGAPLIDALARFGAGLPAHVIPLAVNEITQVGPETLAAAVACGAADIRLLGRARPRHDLEGLRRTLALTNAALEGLGYAARAGLIETDDPDALRLSLDAAPPRPLRAKVSGFLPPATKRALLTLAFSELHRAAPAPVDALPLPQGAPFGAVALNEGACTLCLACVSACPVRALGDDADRPLLSFDESLCVQCGLCAATCPEDALTLVPRLDFAALTAPPRVLKQEPPFCCVECGKPFGNRASIARVQEKLKGHWMFSGPEGAARARVLEMCEDCRVSAVVTESFDPHGLPERRVRTAEDYRGEQGDK